ncbi:hypothetical protein BN1007_71199 [Klebsiella variicola]|nr:hypothetical protein BN1007_71199 [Klebsiella variicola]
MVERMYETWCHYRGLKAGGSEDEHNVFINGRIRLGYGSAQPGVRKVFWAETSNRRKTRGYGRDTHSDLPGGREPEGTTYDPYSRPCESHRCAVEERA